MIALTVNNLSEIAVIAQRLATEFKRILIFPTDPYPRLLRAPHSISFSLFLCNHSNDVGNDDGDIARNTEEIVRTGEDIVGDLRIKVEATRDTKKRQERDYNLFLSLIFHYFKGLFL